MKIEDFSKETTRLATAILEAAGYLWQKSLTDQIPEVSTKADHTMVLNLDIELEKLILEKLHGSLPIASEEDEKSHVLIGSSETYYVIDPIDGTTSCKRFLKSVGGQIGFGPLGGFVRNGHLASAAFFNLPARSLFVAERGKGTFVYKFTNHSELHDIYAKQGRKLEIQQDIPMRQSGVLFYAGVDGELQLIEKLKKENRIENVYRFGGFANDCSRLALGYEQIQIQYAVRAWDLPGALLAELAGMAVVVDPNGTQTALKEWKVLSNNPIVTATPAVMKELLSVIAQ